jgi:hypothetical protein
MRMTVPSVCLAALFLSAPSAEGEVITYTSDAAFLAATTGLNIIDFEGIVAPVPGQLHLGQSGTFRGVTFAINGGLSGGEMFVVGPDVYYPANSVLSVQQSTTGVQSVRIEFGSPVTAFGALFGSTNLDAASINPINFLLSTGDTAVARVGTVDELLFSGLTSVAPFSSITASQATVSPLGHPLNFDDVLFGNTPAPVPEPATVSLISVGLASALAARLKRRRNL